MARKSLFAVCVAMAVFAWSCSDESPTSVKHDRRPFEGVTLSADASPGGIHNALIVSLDKKRSMRRRAYASTREFVSVFAEVANEELQRHGATRRIEHWEVRAVVEQLKELEADGWYDLADPRHADALAAIAYLVELGTLSASDGAAVKNLVEQLPPAHSPIVSADAFPGLPEAEASPVVKTAYDILRSSSDLWRDTTKQFVEHGGDELNYNWFNPTTGSTLADMAGALAGSEFGPAGSILTGAICSIWFYNSIGELNEAPDLSDWPGPMLPSLGTH